ncbi:MtrAB system accessory lipoprotein LpqB [Corynebacterium guangdongense]|uniref:Lipoprotein LpqB n=1 Tax=Corynebacterium guangdongense TaxID=1783348 RepID=A0ABU1ZUU3_9CORY|nr:MtrAB system accessory lipoprotein LpqB [Corynebacterium guangdongense]MDR7328699.1 hypothetical protein [Corynebacterium guangdongense]WJZ17276.1 Lipoprotein LpqB precursor [Corynebacterium guangdongense]
MSLGKYTRRGFLAASAATTLGLAGCATLPNNTAPQALRRFEDDAEESAVTGPEPGREPDLLLRDFYSASAIPVSDHAAARAYLAPETAEQWDPSESMLIVDRLDVTTQAGSTDEQRTFRIVGSVIGSLLEGGSYTPENSVYEASVRMELVRGEWRISSVPNGVVMERMELRNQYEPHNLYFFDTTHRVLVPDRRWLFAGEEQLDSVLLSLLLAGPAEYLRPGVDPALTPDASFAGKSEGVYRFSGVSGLDEKERNLLGAQLTWTLAEANIPAPYRFVADGAPLVASLGEVVPDDFAEYNPRSTLSAGAPLYALTDGRLFEVTSSQTKALANGLGQLDNLESAALTVAGTGAAVQRAGEESVLHITTAEGGSTDILRARTISRPTFEYDANAAWIVVDGRDVVRVVRSAASAEVTQSDVNSAQLDALGGDISMLRLSRTGVRVAMIIDGRVVLGVVSRPPNGPKEIVSVIEIARDLGGSALSVEWQPDGSLLVGTATPETPVWRVEQDGSSVFALPAANITAPVVSVAANSTTMYATDARAALQLPSGGGDNAIWREVPGLQGVRAAVIVAS